MKSKETNSNCLYLHTTLDGKIFYVGIGRIKRAYSKSNRNIYWSNIVNKHNYIVNILVENISWERACELEKLMISFYGRRDLGLGCLVNMTDGGEGAYGKKLSKETKEMMSKIHTGKKLSTEHKKNMSQSHKGRIYSKGFKHTEETKKKMSQSRKGRIGCMKGLKHTEETKKKMSESHKGNTALLGHIHTEETKKKMSESSKNKKSIIQYDLKGNFICKYDSITDASIKLNIHSPNIIGVCKGKGKTTGGFIFKYEI